MKHFFTLNFIAFSFFLNAQVFTGIGGAILNNGTSTSFNLSVSGLTPPTIDSTFGIEEIKININHPKVEQLYIYLQSPSGTVVELSDGTTCSGANYLNTAFKDTVAPSITTSTAPYSGVFKPVGYLGRFNTSQPGNGNWTLIVKDYLAFLDSGSVVNWSITFGNSPAHPVVFKSSNLPIIEINTGGSVISSNSILVNLGVIYNGVGVRNNVTDVMNNYNAKAMIHIRGNSTRYFEKKSYSFETRDLAGTKLVTTLLGLPPESDWELVAPYQDKSLLRIPLTYNIFRQMGHYAPRTVEVEVVINGEYQGVYALTEKVKRDSHRVNISKLTLTDNAWPAVSGGYIIKIDRSDSPGWTSLQPGNSPTSSHFFYQYNYPSSSFITTPQKNYIKSVLDTFETVMNSSTYADLVNGYWKYIDIKSFVDYFIINELSKNVDAYRLSTYMFKESNTHDGKLHIGPVWDYDIAWHNCNYGNSFDPTGWQYQLPDSVSPSPMWWDKFMQDTNFVNVLYCRWNNFRQNILSLPRLNNYIDSSANVLGEAEQRNFTQWPVIGENVWPNPQNQANASYLGEVGDLKAWIANRVAWMDGAITGRCSSVGIADYNKDTDDKVLVYPNPFESFTTFSLNLVNDSFVNLTIVDALGKTISTVLNEHKSQGEYNITFDKKNLPAGIYFYHLIINKKMKTGKIIIL